MPKVFTGSEKSKRSGAIAFGITARKYCPNADYNNPFSPCNVCFAWERNFFKFDAVKNAYSWRGELTKRQDFANIINWELERLKTRPKYFRIHDSGDFYSDHYMNKWDHIVRANPDIIFYCYTKEVKRFLYYYGKELQYLPKNWVVCFSYGGKQDDYINPDIHRHSYVFHDKETLERCEYVDASYDDLVMTRTDSLRIGLVEH